MNLQRIKTQPDVYEPFLLSQGIRVGDFLFGSGQAGYDNQGQIETVKFFGTQNSLCSSFWFSDLIRFQTASDFCNLSRNAI